jgi:predicted TIM-barrel enzyme
METVEDIEALLDATAARDEQIAVLVNAGWSYSAVGRALDVTSGVVAGVIKRRREKRAA